LQCFGQLQHASHQRSSSALLRAEELRQVQGPGVRLAQSPTPGKSGARAVSVANLQVGRVERLHARPKRTEHEEDSYVPVRGGNQSQIGARVNSD
jgi:hypothetical protein